MASTLVYLLGNFVGRLVVSYVIVWLVLLAFSRLNWRQALARSRRWPAVLAVITLAILGMVSRVAQVGGIT